MWNFQKSKKKKYPEYPGFKLGNSDLIANHITTRPRSIYKNWAKNFAVFLISNMIYLYGLIQPMGGRNRVKEPNEVERKNQSKRAFLQIHKIYVFKLYFHDWKVKKSLLPDNCLPTAWQLPANIYPTIPNNPVTRYFFK